MNKLLKLSTFNVYDNFESKKHLVYNILTQASFYLDEETFNKLHENPDLLEENYKKKLLKDKIIVPNDLDEEQYLMKNFNERNDINGLLNLTICITTSCNMKCIYCYEEGIKRITISEHTIEMIVSWIKNYIHKHNIKNLGVLLFGGEPLVAKKELAIVMKQINKLCVDKKVNVTFSIGTNGVLLTKEVASELKKLGLKGAQITIDGPQELQDKRRPMVNSESSFYTIINNIKEVADILQTIIKINIDKQNIDQVDELLNSLENLGIKKSVSFKVEAIAKTPVSSNNQTHYCNINAFNPKKKELALAYLNTIELIENRGFRVDKSTAHMTPCMFTSKSHFIINSDGNIYKCISAVGIEEFKVGNVAEFNFNENYTKFIEFINLSYECFKNKCPYIPKCGAGCPYESYCSCNDIYEVECKKEFYANFYKEKFKRLYDKTFERCKGTS